MASPRIYHLPQTHGGLVHSLAAGERALGATPIIIGEPNPYTAPPDIEIAPLTGFKSWSERANLISRVRKDADIIHFNFGSSLLNPPWRKRFLLDLPRYGSRKKKVMTFQGSDIRQRYDPVIEDSRERERSLGHNIDNSTASGAVPSEEVVRKQNLIAKANAHMDRLFAVNPDLLDGLPKRAQYIPYAYEAPPVTPRQPHKGPLRITHIATNRVLKGTGLIEAELSELAKHQNIETRIVVKAARSDALAALGWADVVIDQMCIGWYGMQAVEAMAMGKPVLCYLNPDHTEKYMPRGQTGMTACHHRDIAKTLSKFCDDRSHLAAQSKAARDFAISFHNPKSIAAQIYKDWI